MHGSSLLARARHALRSCRHGVPFGATVVPMMPDRPNPPVCSSPSSPKSRESSPTTVLSSVSSVVLGRVIDLDPPNIALLSLKPKEPADEPSTEHLLDLSDDKPKESADEPTVADAHAAQAEDAEAERLLDLPDDSSCLVGEQLSAPTNLLDLSDDDLAQIMYSLANNDGRHGCPDCFGSYTLLPLVLTCSRMRAVQVGSGATTHALQLLYM